MPYREKTAWLSLIAMALTFGPYFVVAAIHPVSGTVLPNLHQLGFYAAIALTQVAILGIGHLYLRTRSPEDARTPPDERDLALMRRAIEIAYYVLMAGMCLVGVMMPFTASGWTIVNAAIFMIAAAEVVHKSVLVFGYRRQT